LELAIEPAGEITQRLGDDVLRVGGHVLPVRAGPLDRNVHAVFVVVMAVMTDVSAKLIKVAPLGILKRICDAMQHLVLRRVSPDRGRGVPAVGVEPLPARAVTLPPEAPEPDAGFLPRSAAHQASGSGLEADAEDLGD